MSTLDQLVESARQGVRRRSSEVTPEQLRGQLGTRTGSRPFKEALGRPGLSVIAEFKRGSPSAGLIAPDANVAEVVSAYERGGAAAVSVLTEETRFHGSLADLEAAVTASRLPILRKDFIVDPYQLWEAAIAGADAVLLIVAALANEDLKLLWEEAAALDLDCLVEVHDEEDLERALDLDPEVIGINNRSLRDMTVEPRDHRGAGHRRPRRQDRGSRVRLPRTPPDRGARPDRGRRRPDRRDADALRGSRGDGPVDDARGGSGPRAPLSDER